MAWFFKFFLTGVFLLFLIGIIIFIVFYRSLPNIIKPGDYKPMVVSEVFSDDGTKIGEFYELRRKPIPVNQIPKIVIHSFVAAEDSQFFSHKGIDIRGIIRAAIKNMLAGRVTQGGSTITQQVARSLLLTREKKISRKIKEILLALKLEKELSKEEILYLYLNEIYFGHGAYGVQAASQNYFGKDVSELTLAEAAMLAGLPQAPTRYSPLVNRQAAKERQLYVLERLLEDGYISKVDAIGARDEVLRLLKKHDFNLKHAPYFVEYVRQYLAEKYGYERVYRDGLQIHTTLNLNAQKAANLAMDRGLRDIDKRIGYRGVIGHLKKDEIKSFLEDQMKNQILEMGNLYQAVVTEVDDRKKNIFIQVGSQKGQILFSEMRWARLPNPDKFYQEELVKKPSDVLRSGDLIWVRFVEKDHFVLEQEPQIQGALLSFDHNSGFVKAMIGGYDFSTSEFNRALQAKRQIGSTFKPVIYAAALEKGYTPASIIVDSPIIYREGESDVVEKWKPRNFAERFYGDTTLANALAFSRNIVTVKIAQDISVEMIVKFARKLGIESPLIEDLSMALGSSSLTLDEICRAFAVFARGGKIIHPIFITKVLDRDGNVLEEYKPTEELQLVEKQVITPQLAYLMTDLLKKVIQIGTGKSIKD